MTQVAPTYPIKKDDGRWYKPCSKCGILQSYLRKCYATASLLEQKSCKKCTSINNHPLGLYEDIHISWFRRFDVNSVLRGIEFAITIEDVWTQYIKQGKVCNLTGMDIGWYKGKVGGDTENPCMYTTASIDRIDSSKGYTVDNIQVIHKDLNFMKGVFNQDHFIRMCKAVANRHT
jgi:hypothetical protein